MTASNLLDNKQQLLQDLEQLHSELAKPADPIPVLLEAVLDEDEQSPDLASQMSQVDELLDDDDLLISDDMDIDDLDIDALEATAQEIAAEKISTETPVTKPAPELQLDLGYDLHEDVEEDILPVDTGANEALQRVSDDPINYTGDDLFIDHQNRETHFTETVSESTQPEDTSDAKPLTISPEMAPVYAALQPNDIGGQDENPFLPAHLREKLRQSKAVLLEEIQRSSDSVNASSALLKAYAGDNLKTRERPQRPTSEPTSHQQIIDALVAQYLPLIEQELRKRLKDLVTQTHSSP